MNDPKAAIEYAEKLRDYANQAKEDLLIIMRVYFEKYVRRLKVTYCLL